MKLEVITAGKKLTLTDRHYKAAGGEASIYVVDKTVYKIYHDPKTKSLPRAKLEELSKISSSQVVLPETIVYGADSGLPVGFTTLYIADAHPLVKLFTRAFKDDNNISPDHISHLVKAMQEVVQEIHRASCLIVDVSEMNILVKLDTPLSPWFIDTNSYCTPSFKGTAITDSVRDRRVSKISNGKIHYDADVLSDWFSWGILSFWLYTNIHPFRGGHPNYKPKDKVKQMDDGISVFHPGVRVPPTVSKFDVIPKRHLDWFKEIFRSNKRSIPPMPDTSVPITVPSGISMLRGSGQVATVEVAAYPEPILRCFHFTGQLFAVSKSAVYRDGVKVAKLASAKKLLLCRSTDGTIVCGAQDGRIITFFDLLTQVELGKITSQDFFARNERLYTVTGTKLVENRFRRVATRLVHECAEVENVSVFTASIYDGCVIQDLLGKKYLTLPFKKGASFSRYLPELDTLRIIDAKAEHNVVVILGEKGGVYSRLIYIFDRVDRQYATMSVREQQDVTYDAINFTCNSKGLCLLMASQDELEVFTTVNYYDTIKDPPLDSSMKLFSDDDGFFFINTNTVHQIKKKA